MRDTLIKYFLGLLIFLLSCVEAYSAMQHFTTLTSSNGMNYTHANVICQDSNGFVWLGTHAGLCRYDGIHFYNYPEFDRKIVYALAETDGNWLWIGMEKGLARMNLKTREVEPMRYKGVQELLDVRQVFWGTNGKIYIACALGLFVYDGNQLEPLVVTDEHADFIGQIYAICEESPTLLWMLGKSGLIAYDIQENKVTNYPWPVDMAPFLIASLVIDDKNILYAAPERNSMIRFNTKEHTYMQEYAQEDRIRTYPLLLEDSTLYANTNRGVHVISVNTGKHLSTISSDSDSVSGLHSNLVYSLYKKDRILWMSLFSAGVAYTHIDDKLFNVYDFKEARFSTYGKQIRSFCQTNDGSKLIGTREGLIFVSEKDKSVHTFTANNSALNTNSIIAITPYKGEYLIGTDKGLFLFSTNTMNVRPFSELREFNALFFYCFLKEGDEGMWFGTSDGVLFYDDKEKKITHYLQSDSKTTPSDVFTLCNDAQNRLWIGSTRGVYILDKATLNITDNILPDENANKHLKTNIRSIYRTRSNDLLICTDRIGIVKIDSRYSKYEVYSDANILPSNMVNNIIETNYGVLWIATIKGILSFNPQSGKKQLYTLSAGLPGYAFASHPVFEDNKGNLWWCNEMGLVYCNPAELLRESLCNIPQLTAVSIAGKSLNLIYDREQAEPVTPQYLKSITLNSDDNIELGFSMNIFRGKYDAYECKLEGVDNQWKYIQGETRLSYSDLPPGKHTLRVRGQGNPDYEATFNLIVRYPDSIWYWISAGILLAVVIGLITRYFYRSRRQKNTSPDIVEETLPLAEDTETQKQKVPRLNQDKIDALYKELLNYFEAEKPYLNKQLKISDVAAALSCSVTSLSQVFSFKLNMNFVDFVASYRIEAFIRMLKEKDLSLYTLTSISESCGFNSKTSFFRSFKKLKGSTPLEYIHKHGLKIGDDN